MRNLSLSLLQHCKGEITTLATCWRIKRRDGIIFTFTDHDQPLIIDRLIYQAIGSFTPTSIEIGSQLAVDNLEVTGQLHIGQITEEELLAGKYDFAEVEIFLVNYQNIAASKIMQKRGILGEVTLKNNLFSAEIRGLTEYLSQTMCEEYVPHCRATLGDKRCRFNLKQDGFTARAVVTGVQGRQAFVAASLIQARGWFAYGYLTWDSGKNEGLKMEIKEFGNSAVTLVLPMPYAIEPGDRFTTVAGCDKSSQTCIEKFSNIINFRGEPDVPGTDKILTTAGTVRR
jgi:uncharacterized phage protein (TIGR02218 family)